MHVLYYLWFCGNKNCKKFLLKGLDTVSAQAKISRYMVLIPNCTQNHGINCKKWKKFHPCIFLTLKCNCSVKDAGMVKALHLYLLFISFLPCFVLFLGIPSLHLFSFLMISVSFRYLGRAWGAPHLVSWPARARLPAKNGLVNEVKFLGLITRKR